MTWRTIAASLLFAGAVVMARGADHPASSVAEFSQAVAQAKPGDTITLREGEWKDADLLIEAQGTADQPITLQAAKPGRTILTGLSHLRFGGDHLVVSGLFFKERITRMTSSSSGGMPKRRPAIAG